MVTAFDQLRKSKTFDELRGTKPPDDLGMIAIPRKELPGVWKYNRQLADLLSKDDYDIEDLIPWDVKYDFGRVVGMTEKPDETKDKLSTSLFYSIVMDAPLELTYNFMGDFNKEIFGTSVTPPQAWKHYKNQYKITKGYVEAIQHGFKRGGVFMTKQLAGLSKMESEIGGKYRTWAWSRLGLEKPEYLKGWDKQLGEWGDMMLAGVQEYYNTHPEEAIQIMPGLGYWETLEQYITKPQNLVQGIMESVPLMLEGVLGTVTGGAPLGIIAMGVPISGEVYADAREEGTEPLPAFVRAIGTGTGEAAIEQWTLGRKLGLMKNFQKMVSQGLPKIIWEGLKAFSRGTAEEGSQGYNRNIWRWLFTDRSQQWGENVKESMAAGGPMEMVMAGGFSAAGATGQSVSKEQQTERVNNLRQSVEDSPLEEKHKVEIRAELDKVQKDVDEGVYETKEAETPPTEAVAGPQQVTETRTTAPEGKPATPQGEISQPATAQAPESVQEKGVELKKQPWEMTREEFGQWAKETRYFEQTEKERKAEKLVTRPTHRTIIKKAAEQNKLVPREVLEEYKSEKWAQEALGKITEKPRPQAQQEPMREKAPESVQEKGVELKTKTEGKVVGPKEPVSPIEEVEYTKQEEADIARLEAEIEEPFEMERVKGVGFVIKEKATGKEVEVINKRKLAQQRLAELNEEGKEIKGTRRMPKVLTEKSTMGQLITEAKALKAAMKKAAAAARKAYSQGKKTGIEKVKTHYRELKARDKARRDLKKRFTKAAKTITKNVPLSVDYFYREAIEALRSGIDPSFRREKTLQARKRTKEFLNRHPEKLKNIPVALMKRLSQLPLNEYTIADLEEVAEQIENLKQQGKLKSKLKKAQQQRRLGEKIKSMVSSITKGKPLKERTEPIVGKQREGVVKTARKTRAWTLRPSRIFDMLDGSKKFMGEIHRFFVDRVNKAINTKLRMQDVRKDNGIAKMKELGLSISDLAQTRLIDGIRYTVDQMIGIYNASKNDLAKLAMMYGNNLTEKNIQNVIDNLTKAEKAWGDYIIQDYDNNYNRLRQSVIEVENRDMGYEENYTPIRRTEIDYTTHTEEIVDAILHKEHLRKSYAEKGFTISRKSVPKEFQKPIKLEATSVWLEQIGKQEQYINLAGLVKELHKVASDKDFSAAVEQEYGKEFNTVIRNYVDRVASPNVYKSYNALENASRQLRQNTAVAYLAYNMLTMAKQIPSAFLYLPDAGVTRLTSSAMRFVQNPLKMVNEVREKDPQVKHKSIERELEELKQKRPAFYNEMLAKFGRAGMEGIYIFDTIARTIGWNAVYQKSLDIGMSESEAVQQAQNSTLRTQPAAAAKDLPQMYATNEFFNWFTMFTNQLNQIYNITTYDTYAYWKNAEYAKSALALTGVSITALMIWSLSHKKLPETKEELADAAAEQAINMLPVVGKSVMVGKKAWGDNELPVMKLPKALGSIARKIEEGKELSDAEINALIEGMAVLTGTPYTGPKRIIRAAKEKSPKELIGIKKEKKGRLVIP